MVAKLEDGTLAIWASRDGDDVLWVLNGDYDAGSQLELFPGLAEVEDEDAIIAAAVGVALHGGGTVL